jgi:hypothetical protein
MQHTSSSTHLGAVAVLGKVALGKGLHGAVDDLRCMARGIDIDGTGALV